MKTKILFLFGGILACYAFTGKAQNLGYDATTLGSITTGTNNSAFGKFSQSGNTVGDGNTSVGYKTLFTNQYGDHNTAIGDNALFTASSASNNTAVGSYSLFWHDGTGDNTANGAYSMYLNGGFESSALGAYSLYRGGGVKNTACGHSSLYNATTGAYNTSVGWQAMYSNGTGNRNTAIGYLSLYGTTNDYNVGIGANALYSNTTGSKNTALGYYADVSSGGLQNATAIGYKAKATGSNQIMLGNSSVTAVRTYGDIIWPSDARFKKNIKENVPGLDFIKQLRPVTYNLDVYKLNEHVEGITRNENSGEQFSAEAVNNDEEAISKKEKKAYSGFLAQEVEIAANKLGYDFNGVYHPQNEKDVYGLGYADFVVPLVKAVQELSKENDELKQRIEKLEEMMNAQSPAEVQSAKSVSISAAAVEQNIPNPFNHTTTINYTLPQTYSSAKIIITDQAGKALKELNLSGGGNGSIQVDASAIASGAYQYSLYVDGRLINTKQMVLTK
jgi:hypothetical protein